MKYSFWHRLATRIMGYCFLEYRQPKGFTAPCKFYLVQCKEHGYYEDYAHGHREYFICQGCRKDYEKPHR